MEDYYQDKKPNYLIEKVFRSLIDLYYQDSFELQQRAIKKLKAVKDSDAPEKNNNPVNEDNLGDLPR